MSGWASGNWDTYGSREKRQILAPAVSRQPVRMVVLSGAKNSTYRLENMMVHSASQIGPVPITVCLKVGMMWPVL